MSYIIYSSNGSLLTTIPTGKVNTGSTSLSLVGRDVLSYGRYINQDLVYLLENFSKSTPPKNPIIGQLWFDSNKGKIKVYKHTASTTSFITVGVAEVSGSQPIGQVPGEFWYDTDDSSVNFLNDNGQYVSLTSFPKNNKSGWQYPLNGIHDSNYDKRDVTLLQNNGDVIGAISTASFTVSGVDSTGTFSRADQDPFFIEDGLNIIGNIKATGYVTTNHLKSVDHTNTFTVTVNNNTWTFYRQGTMVLPGHANGVTQFSRIVSTSTFLNFDVQHNSLNNVYGGARFGTDNAKPVDIVTDFTGVQNTWRFDEAGILRLPNGAKINATAISTSTVNYYNYDASGLTISVNTSTVVSFPAFSGQILVNDYNTGQIDLWLVGGGFTYKLGSSKIGNGDISLGNFVHDVGIDGYTWTSNIIGDVSFVATRTRSGA